MTRHTIYAICGSDTSYRSQRLLNSGSRKHPVFLGPVMKHFTKDENTFMRFALEILASNSKLYEIKRIGVDMESAIYNRFKKAVPSISRLVCARHLKVRDE